MLVQQDGIWMDMQIGNKDTGIEFICSEDNCL